MRLDPALREVIVCPACHGTLEERDTAAELVCESCRLAYPVRDDIPVLLVDHARKL
ncbi:Trm112 family protein [Phytoactinopolyspora endophytica]|uniref:Trm112 family protein n=1 Tax=Phytoactinopolyspora endophytica TaxID=1642495 RepID=UPI00101B8952|nr:Trm112 family protein [Phytoactinopolyspora endophytica]